MKIEFFGAARTVTGSKHLITAPSGQRILLDCGLFQNKGSDNETLNRHFGFDPSTVDCVVLSHAHMDHAGLIPYFAGLGFKGPIYCTPATFDLCNIMLTDSAFIQEHDTAYLNKKRKRRNQSPIQPLYTVKDVNLSLKQFRQVPYGKRTEIGKGVSFLFSDSGHILGSAGVHLIMKDNNKDTSIFFSGDIGRSNDEILKAPEPFQQADYIITESTYGNRLHEKKEDAAQRLLNVVINTCLKKKGKLIIPAFSLGRTQEIVYVLDKFYDQGLLPPINVYVDSPLSYNATEVMRKHPECFNSAIREHMNGDPDPFGFNRLQYIREVEESKALNDSKEPCIIISASGMLEAGRIKHHVKNNIGDARNTILIVGYCPPGTLGANLLAHKPVVRIFGNEYEVKADVEEINSYSAHADYEEMIAYLSCQDKKKIKKIFLVHGDYDVQQEYSEKLKAAGFGDIEIPEQGSAWEI
jgi:metallo-beta-lactamase family protein